MILVFSLILVFLWGYLKKFPHSYTMKTVLAVTTFSVLVSLLVSFLSVYGSFWGERAPVHASLRAVPNPVLAQLSQPFYLDAKYAAIIYEMLSTQNVWFRIHFAGVQLLEMPFWVRYTGTIAFICSFARPTVDYTTTLFHQLVLIFTGLNIMGALLAAFTYKLINWGKLKSTIARFQETTRSNSFYRRLFPD